MTMEEEPYEASFYDESYEANTKEEDPLERQLDEISKYFENFDAILRIEDHFQEELNKRISRGEKFDDFVLGIMEVLKSVSSGDSVEKFLREAYIGCLQCLLCLQSDGPGGELYKTSNRLLMLGFLAQALSVIEHVLSERGYVLSNLDSEVRDYEKNTLAHLNKLTECYLSTRPDFKSLREYVELIKDFEVVREIAQALRHLRDEFGELRRHPHRVSRHLNEFTLFSKMEENDDVSWICC